MTRMCETDLLPEGTLGCLLVHQRPATRVMKSWSERVIMGSRMKTTLASEGTLPEATGGSHPVEVSVVIPCLNEANSLAHCVDKAMKAFREAGCPEK